MAFPRIQPAGWSVNQKLKSAEMNQLDIDHAKAINGEDGDVIPGELTCLADIIMDGSNIRVTGGQILMEGSAYADNGGTFTCQGTTLYVDNASTVQFDCPISNVLTVDNLGVGGAFTGVNGEFFGGLYVQGDLAVDGTIKAQGDLESLTLTTLGGTTNLNGVVTVADRVRLTSRSVTVMVPPHHMHIIGSGTRTGLATLEAGSSGSTLTVTAPIDIPEAARLDFVELIVTAPGSSTYSVTGTVYSRFSGNTSNVTVGTLTGSGSYTVGGILGIANASTFASTTSHAGTTYWLTANATMTTSIATVQGVKLTYVVDRLDER